MLIRIIELKAVCVCLRDEETENKRDGVNHLPDHLALLGGLMFSKLESTLYGMRSKIDCDVKKMQNDLNHLLKFVLGEKESCLTLMPR